jgi:hypothetical protein
MRLVFDDGERCWPVATLVAGDRTRVDVTATPTLVLIEVDPPDKAFAFPSRCSSETRLDHVEVPQRKIAPPAATRRLCAGARGEG